jgi:hypothetical protein
MIFMDLHLSRWNKRIFLNQVVTDKLIRKLIIILSAFVFLTTFIQIHTTQSQN